MAFIKEFEEFNSHGSDKVHGEVMCGFKIFELGSKRYLQLDTYGSSERKIQGKVSQSFQIDEAGAAYLAGLLTRAFPAIRAVSQVQGDQPE